MIVAGSRSQVLAGRVARSLGVPLAEVRYEEFPDGERLVRVPGLDGVERVVVVASTPTDSSYVELLQLVDACSDAGEVNLVLPYMGYSRQDKEFREGEAVSAHAIARGVRDVDSVSTVNVHEPSVLDWFDCPARDLDASGALADAFDLDSPLVVSPDGGAVDLARNLADSLDGDSNHLRKTRVSGDEVEVEPKKLSAEGRDVVLVDDMISTGGTMQEAIRVLDDQGAERVYAACVHPVLAGSAVVDLYRAGVEEVVATDTLETAVSRVSVAGVIADSL